MTERDAFNFIENVISENPFFEDLKRFYYLYVLEEIYIPSRRESSTDIIGINYEEFISKSEPLTLTLKKINGVKAFPVLPSLPLNIDIGSDSNLTFLFRNLIENVQNPMKTNVLYITPEQYVDYIDNSNINQPKCYTHIWYSGDSPTSYNILGLHFFKTKKVILDYTNNTIQITSQKYVNYIYDYVLDYDVNEEIGSDISPDKMRNDLDECTGPKNSVIK